MKKAIVFLLVAAVSISMAGCGKKKNEISFNMDTRGMGNELHDSVNDLSLGRQDNLKEAGEKVYEDFEKNKKPLSDLYFEDPNEGSMDFTSYYLYQNKEGKDLLVVEFDYTNKSDVAAFPDDMLNKMTFYQDDVGLNRYTNFDDYFYGENIEKDLNNKVRAGGTVTARATYELRNTDSDIVIELVSYDYGTYMQQNTVKSEGTFKIK